ncbi:uncharacterized protein LOC132453053 isoform X2 [Gadus macrocephalus]|uniref:uncharacterized protein LOC132453053 isoform X2 n=1 Tax=Gadus macrocephalus TaxID=80720 RepID=UPI0028CB8175|nr:uncharacterized protein LOC132453053 isoform X2 [Gadus macrocephalus]
MATISKPDPGLSEEPGDASLDRRERRKRGSAGRAKKKANFRRRGSRQRVTMVTISEPNPGLSEDPEDTSLDREEIRKRRFALWFHITVIVSIGLLSILLISLRFNSPSPWKEGRENLLDELDELTLQGWMLHDKSFYRVSTTKKGWRASREDCQKRKADLVVINSREELAFVSRLMGSSWIGLSDREKEGTHKWVDGTPMTSSWRHVKPRDDGGARDCVVAGEDGWSEEPCNRLHHWICEKVLDLDHLEAERNKEGSVMPTEEEEAPSITEFHSSTHVLPVGQTARYTCHAGGTPEPTVEWLHNGRPLERDGTDDQSEAWVERGFLFVRGGRYGVNTVCCVASNSAGTANHSAELLVFDELTLQGWMLHDKSLYRVSTTKKGWRASREDCQKRKADLVVINSREELNQVSRFVSRLMGSSWIGLSDREKEGSLKWVDGTPMTSSWRHVKPRDDGGARDCVVAGEDGWSEEPCNRLHHWICEKVLDLDHLEAERNKEGSVMPTEEEEAPSITEFHSSTHVLPVGQTARYTCHAGGTPEPTVEWLHNGRPLERDGTDDQSEAWVESGFLFVRGGRYGVNTVCCMASNSAGTANHSAELLVFDACDLTLDPNTAYRDLSLSEDNRKVTRGGVDQSYPDHPDRFDWQPQVLGREALTGRCYWEVEWEGWVRIGVTYRGITRRGGGDDSWLGWNNKSWSLDCYDDHYSVWYNGRPTVLPLPPAGSTRVGVYLDRPAGSLSFYRVSPGGGGSSDTLTHIHTFWSSFTQEDLLPGLWVWRSPQGGP